MSVSDYLPSPSVFTDVIRGTGSLLYGVLTSPEVPKAIQAYGQYQRDKAAQEQAEIRAQQQAQLEAAVIRGQVTTLSRYPELAFGFPATGGNPGGYLTARLSGANDGIYRPGGAPVPGSLPTNEGDSLMLLLLGGAALLLLGGK